MVRKIEKTNIILVLLVIAFFSIVISLILDLEAHSITPNKPIIIEIEEHQDTKISHGGDQWPLNCEQCHTEPVYGDCSLPECHPSPDYMVGDDDSIYFAHHDPGYPDFKDCGDQECHDTVSDDIRYVKGDLITDGDWHTYCENCHENYLHRKE